MAEKIFFKIRKAQLNTPPSNQVETPVYLKFNFGYCEIDSQGKKTYTPLTYPTGIKIKPCYWNGKPIYRAKQSKHIDYTSINIRLDNIEGMAKKAYRTLINKGVEPNLKNIKDEIDKLDGKVIIQNESLNLFIDRFIREIESGERLNQSKRYSQGTIKNYKGFQVQFDLYQKSIRKKLDFEHITMDFYNDFVQFFTLKNYSPNTLGRHVKNLKTIMRYAQDEGLHKNTEYLNKSFKTTKEQVQNVYLNKEEIQLLKDLNLTEKPVLDLCRDVFLVGCYTAQRYSDYSRINESHIRTLSNGSMIIDMIQEKTEERVIIPICPELKEILSKYDYNLPKTYEQKVNAHIKQVAKLAGINDVINLEKTQGGLKVKTKVPKYELIKTHTARRSGCTNMYLAGIQTLNIMKISGHKSEKEFLNYIKVSKEETAVNLSAHPYFREISLKKI